MVKSGRFSAFISNSLLAITLTALWIAFAPTGLGGQVTYVIINGISMEPGYHTGDLVLLRRAVDYQVGDVIAYYYPDMHANVIHRIVNVKNDRYTIKGDNNSWLDGYLPTRSEILGKQWLYLPKLATYILWFRTPIHISLMTVLVGGLFMVSMTTQKPRKQARRRHRENSAGIFEMALYIIGGLFLASLALAIFVFIRPFMRTADKIPYKQTGSFAYTASGAPEVYDTGAARSGEPVFSRLACTLNLGFAYNLEGVHLKDVSGKYQFVVQLQDPETGWQRTIPITSDTTFTGNSFSNRASVNLCKLEDLVTSVGDTTGVRSRSNALVIAAHVSVSGNISGVQFSDSFEPHLTFQFDSLQFYLVKDSSQKDPLQTVKSDFLNNPGLVDNTINLFGLKPTVRVMRVISEYGLGVSLCGLLILGLIYLIVSNRSEEAAIRLKYGALIVEVYDLGLENLSPMIEVTTMEDLAKLAERYNAMIMHLQREFLHMYIVQAEGINYRYGHEQKQPGSHPGEF
jgi:signal peptidase I